MGKKRGGKVGKVLKKVGRKHMKVLAKAAPVVTGVLAGAGTLIGGPALGLGITAAGAGIGRVAGAGAARDKGYRGRHARNRGRNVMQRSIKYGLGGTALGFGASLVAGGSVATGLLGAAGSGVGKVAPKAGAPSADSYTEPQDSIMSAYAAAGGPEAHGVSRPQGWEQPSPGSSAWTDTLVTTLGMMSGGLGIDPGNDGSGNDGPPTTSPLDMFGNVGEDSAGARPLMKEPFVIAGLLVAAALILPKMMN